MSRIFAVVIPAFGKVEMTRLVVQQCLEEDDMVDVYVVDNAGDYLAVADERLIHPGKNLGWLKGTNLGFQHALIGGRYEALMSLNNDTTLSENFFAAMGDALSAHPAVGLLAPSYDDSFDVQNNFYTGPAAAFPARPEEVATDLVDGTCFAIPTPAFLEIGFLDARRFGRRGWGAVEDLAVRTREHQRQILVTRRAYLSHNRGATSRSRWVSYERYAAAEARRGMRGKWGPAWRDHFSRELFPPRDRFDRLRDSLRAFEDRVGLSETWVGRRGSRLDSDRA